MLIALVALFCRLAPVEAQGIIHVQLPPSPSLGLIPDKDGNLYDPYAEYDPQGLRLIGTDRFPATYDLVLNGQVHFTFASRGQTGGFAIDPVGNNKVVGVYLDSMGAPGAYAMSSGSLIGPDPISTSCPWLGHSPVFGAVTIASAVASGSINDPVLFSGPFAGMGSGYIGLQFFENGQPYYGWVRIGAPISNNGGWIYEFAYQSTPNTPILAGEVPEPGTLALLSLSGFGMFVMQTFRKRSAH